VYSQRAMRPAEDKEQKKGSDKEELDDDETESEEDDLFGPPLKRSKLDDGSAKKTKSASVSSTQSIIVFRSHKRKR